MDPIMHPIRREATWRFDPAGIRTGREAIRVGLTSGSGLHGSADGWDWG